MVVGGRKGDGVVGGAGGVKGGTHHLINFGNSRPFFASSADESFKKNSRHRVTRRFFFHCVNDALTRIVPRVPSTAGG